MTAFPPPRVCSPGHHRVARLGSLAWAALATLLTACSTPPSSTPPADAVPPAWHATLPHGGDALALAGWWSRFDDPLLPALIDAAQGANPTLSQAAARVAQARANASVAGAGRWPALNANAGLTRSRSAFPTSAAPGTAGTDLQTSASATLDASWELDLFGRVRQGVDAARARADASLAQWHEARVSLAAEVAGAYASLRSCEAVLAVFEQDRASQAQTAELTDQKVRAGFEAPAFGALTRAGAAEAANRVEAQRTSCEINVKQLVQLTALPEASLRERLAASPARLPQPAAFDVASVPAEVLSQRPDLAAAERGLVASAAEVGVAQADRYPRLSLAGSIGRAGLRVAGQTIDGTTWSFGPALLAPIVDGGRRRAEVEAALARHDEAVGFYREQALRAVREVEEALLRLDAAGRREGDAKKAADGYGAFFEAAQTQWRVGVGNLLDLEQARRNALSAEAAWQEVRLERLNAWLQLYKAVGGGWQPEQLAAAR